MPDTFRRAVWMDIRGDVHTPKDAAAFVDWCRAMHIDLAFPCLNHCTGFMTYPSDVAPYSPAADAWDPTAEIAARCRDAGIECHAWVCIGNWGRPDPAELSPNGPAPLAHAHPEWFCVDQSGRSMLDPDLTERYPHAFLNLGLEEVQDFHVRLCREVLDRYPFDGYHLDYIRFTFHPERALQGRKEAFAGDDDNEIGIRVGRSGRFSFDDRTLAAFEAEPGTALAGAGATLPERVAWLYADEERRQTWYAWRASKVTGLVRRLREETHRHGRQLSAAVFAGYPWCGQEVAQRWPTWVDDRLLDLVVPMDYGLEPDAFVQTLDAQQAHLQTEPKPAVPFIAGILGFEMFEGLAPDEVRETIALFERLAREHGQTGLSLFCYGRFRQLLGG